MSTNSQRVSTISPLDIRNDLHLTSTGIGHVYQRDTATFPPEHIKDIFSKPLPSIYTPVTARPSDYCRSSTTFRNNYYYKTGHSSQNLYKKSPSLLKLNYAHDTINKLHAKAWRNPLTMGNQRSEMRDKYEGKRDTIIPSQQPPMDQSYLMEGTLYDHHTNGLTQRLQSTLTNKALKGAPFHAEDQSVHHRNQPYMTTHHYYYRQFPCKELTAYPKKDGATYWLCEDYPKAWGHGSKENPLPSMASSNNDKNSPMIDKMVFKTRTHLLPTSQRLQLVSNGSKTEYQRYFVNKPRHEIFKQLAQPLIIRTDKDTTLMRAVPNMYNTSNQMYGSVTI